MYNFTAQGQGQRRVDFVVTCRAGSELWTDVDELAPVPLFRRRLIEEFYAQEESEGAFVAISDADGHPVRRKSLYPGRGWRDAGVAGDESQASYGVQLSR